MKKEIKRIWKDLWRIWKRTPKCDQKLIFIAKIPKRKDQNQKKTKVKEKSEKEKKERSTSTTTMDSEETQDQEDGVPQVPNEELIDELAEAMGTMNTGSTSDVVDVRPENGDDEPITFD